MGISKNLMLFLLLLIFAQSLIPRGVEARLLPISKQERYVKVLATLGINCRCCDGIGGECANIWDSSCKQLDCRPQH